MQVLAPLSCMFWHVRLADPGHPSYSFSPGKASRSLGQATSIECHSILQVKAGRLQMWIWL